MKHRDDDQDRADEEMLTRLLSLADEGPPIPREGIERTRGAVRQVWLETVRSRRRRRIRWSLGAVAAAVMLVALLSTMMNRPATGSAPILAQVEALHGEAWIETATGHRVRLVASSAIPDNATVTSAAGARMALRLSTGYSVRIDRSTIVTFLEADHLRLDRGAVYVDSGLIHSVGIRVTTPLGDASDIGTSFLVRYENERLRVLVRSGVVLVDLPDENLRLDRGRGVVISPGSDPEWLTVTPYASDWEWARAVAPPFEVEGRTVDAFLRWYERETGRAVRYSDQESERLARQTTIYGGVVEVAPELAAESILLSAGLEGAARNGELVIRPINSAPNDSIDDH